MGVEVGELEEPTSTASCSKMSSSGSKPPPPPTGAPEKKEDVPHHSHQSHHNVHQNAHQNAHPPPQQHHQIPSGYACYYTPYGYPYHPHQFYQNPHLVNSQQQHQQTASETVEISEHTPSSQQAPQQFFGGAQYQVIPAGAISVRTINIDPSQICPVDQMGMWAMPPPIGPDGMRYGIPIPPTFVPQIMTNSTSSMALMDAMMKSSHTNHNDSSSESGVSGVKDDEEKKTKEEEQREERQSTSDYTDDDPIPLTRRSTTSGNATCNYAEQIEERRRFELEQEKLEKREMEEVDRQRRLLEERRNSEEQQRLQAERKRHEEETRRLEQFKAAMEKAKREAELLKKAKIYKHVFRGAEEQGDEQLGELEQKFLGVDLQTGRRLLKEVSEVEWHKKQDQVEIRKKAPEKNEKGLLNQTTSAEKNQRGRSLSISQPSPSPFTRNSTGRRSVRTTSREKDDHLEHISRPAQLAPRPPPPHQTPPSPPPTRSPHREPPLEQRQPSEGRRLLGSVRPPSTLPTFGHQSSEVSKERNEEEEEAMMRTQYYPMDRGPLSPQEKERIGRRPPTTISVPPQSDSSKGLFGTISTRSSFRRGPMRGPMQSPVQIPSAHRSPSFEESSSGGEEATGSISPDLINKHSDSPLPSSTENVHPAPESPKNDESFEYKTPQRTRSALGSSLLNGDSAHRRPSSTFLQKLEQKGHITKNDERNLSEDIRHLATSSLSRAGSMADIRSSFQNLSLRGSHLNLASSGEPSPNLSKFASVNSPARQSLSSLRKTTDRQVALLDRLNRLRESLHSGKNYTPPRHHHSTASSRIQTPAATPPPVSPTSS